MIKMFVAIILSMCINKIQRAPSINLSLKAKLVTMEQIATSPTL